MPVLPGLVERLALRLNRVPAPLIDVYAAVGFRILLAGVRLGVFEALSADPRSSRDLAVALGTDERGTALLLETLESLGYVRRAGDLFANTPVGEKWLTGSGESDFYLHYWGRALAERWDDLEESISAGGPTENLYHWLESRPEASNEFQRGLIAIARLIGGEVAGASTPSKTSRRGSAMRASSTSPGRIFCSRRATAW